MASLTRWLKSQFGTSPRAAFPRLGLQELDRRDVPAAHVVSLATLRAQPGVSATDTMYVYTGANGAIHFSTASSYNANLAQFSVLTASFGDAIVVLGEDNVVDKIDARNVNKNFGYQVRIDGGTGNDFLAGSPGRDLIIGGGGNDTINGGLGDDLIYGGGRPEFFIGDPLVGSTSSDGYQFSIDATGTGQYSGGPGNTRADQVYRPDTMVNSGNDILHGNDGLDEIYGGDGDDGIWTGYNGYLTGEEGESDRGYGGHGHDKLFGGEGRDYLEGGFGNDTIVGGNGHDHVYAGAGDDVVYGQNGSDVLNGQAGNDTLYGGDSADVLYGGDGDDKLFGDEGNDILHGGNGNDTLDGGAGSDTLYGNGDFDKAFNDGLDLTPFFDIEG